MLSWMFGKKSKKNIEAAPPENVEHASIVPPIVSVEGLSDLFGEDGVCETTNVVLKKVPNLSDATTKFGGLPGFSTASRWPHCACCKDPMMFVGQVAAGPHEPLHYPEQAILYIFLCQSDPTAKPECETWSPTSGCSSVFTLVDRNEDCNAPVEYAPPGLEELIADSYTTPGKVRRMWDRLSLQGNKEYRTTLFGQYECELRSGLSVCDQPPDGMEHSEAHYAAMGALANERAVFIGGFADWVQAPSSTDCTCGKPMEFVMQFGSFDEAINLGDAGEAYIFACPDRCSPTSFALEWQCC